MPESAGKSAVECQECGFRLRPGNLRVRRLSFPAVGVPGCGKTHMLVTTYDTRAEGPRPLDRRAGAARALVGDADIDRTRSRISSRSRIAAGETRHDLVLPDPVLFHLRDNGPRRGQLRACEPVRLLRRALNDTIDRRRPAQVHRGADGRLHAVPRPDAALRRRWHGDDQGATRQAREVPERHAAGTRRRRRPADPGPVAVCIPKFDLLLVGKSQSAGSRSSSSATCRRT